MKAMRALIVEDSDGDQILLKRFLSPYCASITSVSDLDAADEVIRSTPIDIIILDLRLERSDVDNTLAHIRLFKRIQPECAVLVCSGMPIQNLREKAELAGADRFLEKGPVIYQDNARALLIAVNVAMMHHPRSNKSDSYDAHMQLLQAAASSS